MTLENNINNFVDSASKVLNVKGEKVFKVTDALTTYASAFGDSGKYKNPDAGLLIMGGITNKNFFEFYIQPQEVTMGSATPTCFHVAYGNMDFAEKIPKFTFDLCHIYSNWQGTVRIPNVIKCAEKLSKMTAKYTMGELNPDLKFGQVYL